MGFKGGDEGAKSSGLALLLHHDSSGHPMRHGMSHGAGGSSDKPADSELGAVVSYVLELAEGEVVACTDGRINYGHVQAVLAARAKAYADSAGDAEEDGAPDDGPGAPAAASGRVGPAEVRMDEASASGRLVYELDGLAMESAANFSSARATTCVFKGRWMYEATVGTEGIQQLGWATLACPFTGDEGVGDAPDSYAYDGKRLKKWNVQCLPYGEAWAANDVIGCCIDLDAGEVSFSRNGRPLGTAYTGVRTRATGAAYFPALSLSYAERCHLNFGARPFAHPAPGFRPLQPAPPAAHQLHAADLLTAFARVAKLASRADCPEAACVLLPRGALPAPDAALLAAALAPHLAPLLATPYLVHSHLLPTLLDLHGRAAPHCAPALASALHLLHATLPAPVFASALTTLLTALALHCKTGALVPGEPLTAASYPHLALAAALARLPAVRALWVAHPHFHWVTAALLTRKPPTAADLKLLVPQVWWPGCNGGTVAQAAQERVVAELAAAIDAVDGRMLALCASLLLATRPADVAAGRRRSALEAFLEQLLHANRDAGREGPRAGLSDHSVLNSVFYVLLRLLRPHLQAAGQGRGPLATFPIGRLFVQEGGGTGSGNLAEPLAALPRLGGIVSHLAREMRVPPRDLQDPPLDAPHPLPGAPGLSQVEDEAAAALPPEAVPRLLTSALLLYTWRMGPTVRMADSMVVQGANTRATLEELGRHLGRAGQAPEYRQYLTQMRTQLCDELTSHSRLLALWQPALLSARKQEALFSLAAYLAAVVRAAADRGPLLAWVPTPCLELPLDLLAWLRHCERPFAPPAAVEDHGLQPLLGLLARLLDDPRICYPEVKDALLATAASLLDCPAFRGVLERSEEARRCLVPAVLRSFDSRLWHPVSLILHRLLRSSGFGQGAAGAGGGALSVFQRQVQAACVGGTEAAGGFMTRLLNTLNWSLTEFAVIISDVHEHPSRWTQHSYLQDPSQSVRKCIIMFDLSTQLLRSLEFVAREAPATFLAASRLAAARRTDATASEEAATATAIATTRLNFTRLLEVVGFTLAHFTTGADARKLREVLQRAPAQGAAFLALDRISVPAILGPVVGILLGLHRAELLASAADDAADSASAALQRLGSGAAASTSSTSTSSAAAAGGGPPRQSELVAALAGSSNAGLVAYLDYLPTLDWRAGFPGDPTLPLHLRLFDDLLHQVHQHRKQAEAEAASGKAEAGEGAAAAETPEEFLDPITLEVMADPVVLPDSGVTVDRSTILRHLLSHPNDPFSRSALSADMLRPDEPLAARLRDWRAGRASRGGGGGGGGGSSATGAS